MNLDDWRDVFLSISTIIIIGIILQFVMLYIPTKQKGVELFISMGILGNEGKIGNYFPENNPTIELGEKLNWTLYIHNRMGEAKYVFIKFKLFLFNSSIQSPNSTLFSPSPAPSFYEIKHVILYNETWLYPITWSIQNVSNLNKTEITSIILNDVKYPTSVSISKDFKAHLCLVFELGVYDEASKEFRFQWMSNNEVKRVWNQIIFTLELS